MIGRAAQIGNRIQIRRDYAEDLDDIGCVTLLPQLLRIFT